MKKTNVMIVLGMILSLPIIYILELEGSGAITLLVFICVGLMISVSTVYSYLMRKESKNDKN